MAALASSEKTPLQGQTFPFIYYTSCYVLYCRSKSAYSGQYMTVTPWKTKTNFGESVPWTKKVIQIEKGEDTIQNPLKLPELSRPPALTHCRETQAPPSWGIIWSYVTVSPPRQAAYSHPNTLARGPTRSQIGEGRPKGFHKHRNLWQLRNKVEPMLFQSIFFYFWQLQPSHKISNDAAHAMWYRVASVTLSMQYFFHTLLTTSNKPPSSPPPPAQPLPEHSDLLRILTDLPPQRKVNPIWVYDRKALINCWTLALNSSCSLEK